MSQALLPQNYKGYFASEASLIAAIPNGLRGYWAIVEDVSGVFIWNANLASWENAGQSGGAGDVVGPASSTDNAIVLFDGLTGKLIKDSTTLLATTATVSSAVKRDSNANIFVNNYFANSTVTPSAAGTTILTASSSRNQALTGSSSQNYQLPDATTLPLGPNFVFNNNSSSSLVIKNAGGSTLYTVPAGGLVQCGPTDISTSNGVWDFHPLPPSTVTWGSGTTGLVFNTALSTTPAIDAGASSSTNATFRPQRGTTNVGYSGDSTHLYGIVGGAAVFTATSAGLVSTALGVTDSTQAEARFTTPVVTITGDTTLGASHWGKKILFNSASAITITVPQQSTTTTVAGVWFQYENINAGTVTFVKQGAETLSGNTTVAAGAGGNMFRDTTTNWAGFGGTATLNMPGLNFVIDTITTSETLTLVGFAGCSMTILGLYQKARSVGTAGSFAIKINGTDITGLGAVVPSTAGSYTTATAANTIVRGDQITIVANGTLATIADLGLTLDYTMQF